MTKVHPLPDCSNRVDIHRNVLIKSHWFQDGLVDFHDSVRNEIISKVNITFLFDPWLGGNSISHLVLNASTRRSLAQSVDDV